MYVVRCVANWFRCFREETEELLVKTGDFLTRSTFRHSVDGADDEEEMEVVLSVTHGSYYERLVLVFSHQPNTSSLKLRWGGRVHHKIVGMDDRALTSLGKLGFASVDVGFCLQHYD